jgi:hypothetical protein
MLDAYRIQASAGPVTDKGVLMNTSLEGGTMATYHVSVIIDTPDGNDEENEVEQAMLDLAAEHMWRVLSLTVLA